MKIIHSNIHSRKKKLQRDNFVTTSNLFVKFVRINFLQKADCYKLNNRNSRMDFTP